jgi:hypothetical protein
MGSSSRRATRRTAPLLAAAVAACAAAPPPVAIAHQHRVATTVTVTDDAILPAARVVIPRMSSLVWRNAGSAPLEVSIAAATCGGCDTVFGFRPVAEGSRCTAIAPGAVAAICFHEDGTFPFTARSGGRERTGEVVVGGGR